MADNEIQSYDTKTGTFKENKKSNREMIVHKDIELLYSLMIFIVLIGPFLGSIFILFTGNYFNYFKQSFVFGLFYIFMWLAYGVMREIVKTKKNSLTHHHFQAIFSVMKYITIGFLAINLVTILFVFATTKNFSYLLALDERTQENFLMVYMTAETFFRAIFIGFTLFPLMRMSADYSKQENPDIIPEDGTIHAYLSKGGHKIRKLLIFNSLVVGFIICYFLPTQLHIDPQPEVYSKNSSIIEITQDVKNNPNLRYQLQYRTVYSNSNWACDTNMDQDFKYEPFQKNRVYGYSPYTNVDSRSGTTTFSLSDHYFKPGFCKYEFEGVEYQVQDKSLNNKIVARGSFRLDTEQFCPQNLINIKTNPNISCALDRSSKYSTGDENFFLTFTININDYQRAL